MQIYPDHHMHFMTLRDNMFRSDCSAAYDQSNSCVYLVCFQSADLQGLKSYRNTYVEKCQFPLTALSIELLLCK